MWFNKRIHLQRKKFEKLFAVNAVCTEERLLSKLEKLRYRREYAAACGDCHTSCLRKGRFHKHYVLISNSGESLICQFERIEETAGKILENEKKESTKIIAVCFAETGYGCKNIFETYLKFEAANSYILGSIKFALSFTTKRGSCLFSTIIPGVSHITKRGKLSSIT
jgi:hypothetical protein